nr:unnamed protein product [Haemonchus contortus]
MAGFPLRTCFILLYITFFFIDGFGYPLAAHNVQRRQSVVEQTQTQTETQSRSEVIEQGGSPGITPDCR